MPGDSLAEIVERLPAPWRGHYFAELESTQDLAREAARLGAADRSVYVADFQRSGRGRQGRRWTAPRGSALLLSIIFRDALALPWRYTCLASLGLVQAIECGRPMGHLAIKWPNDVMLADQKVAGILAETRSDGNELVAIVGIGINVSEHPRDVVGATNLADHTNGGIDRGSLLLGLLHKVDALRALPHDELHRVWDSRLWRRGQRLRLLDATREEEVVILGAAADGSLRVRTSDGLERVSSTGELLA
jgi:BirA family biotin operon repressor/biotin-[acetyl-CoA-carboxylase] ligase